MDVAEIVKAVVEGRDLDLVLDKQLEGLKEEEQLGRFVALLGAQQENHEHVGTFIRHAWKYMEKNPGIWHRQYSTIEELQDEVGYENILLPPKTRMEREKRSVLGLWKVQNCQRILVLTM
jgi:hypothetical protein